jgi:hypothetical protein
MTIADAWKIALTVLASLGGGSVIVLSLSNWLGKAWAHRLMERDRAQYAAELERAGG